MAQLEFAVLWAGLGVAATLICALVAERIGWVQIKIAREAHQLNVTKAAVKIGFALDVDERQLFPQGYNPHIHLTAKIYNEGELAAKNIDGQWKLIVPNGKDYVFPIQRDFIGNSEPYLHVYKIDESCNWPRDSIRFNVHVEFRYSVPSERENRRYHAEYQYDRESRRMVRTNWE
jgi:hypothetical protein